MLTLRQNNNQSDGRYCCVLALSVIQCLLDPGSIQDQYPEYKHIQQINFLWLGFQRHHRVCGISSAQSMRFLKILGS